MSRRRDDSWMLGIAIVLIFVAFNAMMVYAFSLNVKESQPTIEPGIAVVGEYCEADGTWRKTKAGELAMCAYVGPNGDQPEWTLPS